MKVVVVMKVCHTYKLEVPDDATDEDILQKAHDDAAWNFDYCDYEVERPGGIIKV